MPILLIQAVIPDVAIAKEIKEPNNWGIAVYQNQIRGSGLDIGLQFRYKPFDNFDLDFEGLSDKHGRNHAITAVNYHWDSGNWDLYHW